MEAYYFCVLIIHCIPCRLDQILGKQGSKAKDVYESKISLASRIVKVERQVRAGTLQVGVCCISGYFTFHLSFYLLYFFLGEEFVRI